MASQRIPKIDEFPQDGKYWRVDWLGGIERNSEIPTEPFFQAIISPFFESICSIEDKGLGELDVTDSRDKQKTIRIGIGQLPAVETGSIWKDGICQDRVCGQIFRFPYLDITDSSTRVITANYKHFQKNLIPFNHYRYGRAGAFSKILAVEWNGDPFGLLIPMMELMRFYYAVSSNLSHAIFSGAFKHDLNSIVNIERTSFLKDEDRVLLGLRQHVTDEEGWMIARILKSKEAWSACTQIHDNIMAQTINSKFAQVETGFPFQGRTALQVRYKPITSYGDNKTRKLVLSIGFCNAPFPFKKLTIIRDNDGLKANPATDLTPEDKKSMSRGQPSSKDLDDKNLQSKRDTDKEILQQEIRLPTNRFLAISGLIPDKPTKDQCDYRSDRSRPKDIVIDELGTGLGAYGEENKHVQTVNLVLDRQRKKAAPPSFETFEEAVQKLNSHSDVVAIIRSPDEATRYMPLTKPSYIEAVVR